MAMAILTVIATVTVKYVNQPVDRTKLQAYDLRVQQLEILAKQYQADYGRLPSSTMRELSDSRYLGEAIPFCPVDGRPLLLDIRTGTILPHAH